MEAMVSALSEHLGNLFLLFMRTVFTAPLQVFTKRDFGERYLPTWMIVISASVWFSVIGSTCVPDIPGYHRHWRSLIGNAGATFAAFVFVGGFVALAIHHRRVMAAKRRKGIMWHSRCPGIPHRRLGPDQSSLTHYVKIPAMALGIGVVLAPFCWMMLPAMFWCGAAYAFERMLFTAIFRGRVLNALDAKIDAEYFGAALRRNDPDSQSGLSVPPVLSPKEQETFGSQVGEALIGIDPRLRVLRKSMPGQEPNGIAI